jgi:hypothetical protein
VRAGDTARAGTLRLLAEDQVGSCMKQPNCAALLRPDTAALRGLTDGERILEALHRTTIALVAGRSARVRPGTVPCVRGTNPRVFGALAARFPALVPAPGCRPVANAARSGRPGEPVYSDPSFLVSVGEGWRVGNTVFARTVSRVGGERTETWECRLTREDGVWTPRTCHAVEVP